MQGTCLRYVETDDPNMSAYTEREKRLHGTLFVPGQHKKRKVLYLSIACQDHPLALSIS